MALSPQYGWAEPDNSSLVKNGAADIRTLGDAIDTSVWNVGFGQGGKNKIINGDFSINQRSFTSATATGYTFDRWSAVVAGTGTSTFTAQTFTPGAAPVAGYEGSTFARIVTTGQSGTNVITRYTQVIENVRTFAGQTATVSFWAKAATGTPSISLELSQNYGLGGSPSTQINIVGGNVALTTSWARYSITVAIPSLTGKTLGTTANTSYLEARFWVSAGSDFNARTGSLGIQSNTFDFWGIQAEYGAKMTPFQTASGGSLQGELAMCQRYYWRLTPAVASGYLLTAGNAYNATNLVPNTTFPCTMRIAPTSVDYSAIQSTDGVNVADVTTLTMYYATPNSANFIGATTGATQYRNYALTAKTTSSYLGFSAEF